MINFICLCFKVFANESESEERLSGFAIVEVDLININDNEPKFNQSSYNFTYDEEIHEGFVIGTVMVRICYSFLFCFMFVDVSSRFRWNFGEWDHPLHLYRSGWVAIKIELNWWNKRVRMVKHRDIIGNLHPRKPRGCESISSHDQGGRVLGDERCFLKTTKFSGLWNFLTAICTVHCLLFYQIRWHWVLRFQCNPFNFNLGHRCWSWFLWRN